MNDSSINVYGIEEDYNKQKSEIVPYYTSNYLNTNDKSPIHTLIIATVIDRKIDNDKSKKVYHFAWIQILSCLVSMQTSKHKAYSLICDRCLCHFYFQYSYENHRQDCINIYKIARMILSVGTKCWEAHRFNCVRLVFIIETIL
ncbi:hypothetical protein PV327_008805 [Microctonus hyperodae]|uniref:Uncharacterized protein n=1 Tax=Microctonus hyperodae TaxID=165561 RepID=A0AA39FSH3_MICHY|nr:hypothetical protein PV327_008805 [Microctonus hyperodae]